MMTPENKAKLLKVADSVGKLTDRMDSIEQRRADADNSKRIEGLKKLIKNSEDIIKNSSMSAVARGREEMDLKKLRRELSELQKE